MGTLLKSKIILFVLSAFFTFTSSVSAETLKEIEVTYLVYGGYAPTLMNAKYSCQGEKMLFQTDSDYSSKIPDLFDITLANKLIENVEKNKVCSVLPFPLSEEEVHLFVLSLSDSSRSDIEDIMLLSGITKIDCINILSHFTAQEISKYLTYHDRLIGGPSIVNFRFVFDSGRTLSIRPRSDYNGDYWIVDNNSKVDAARVIPYIEKMGFNLEECKMDKELLLIDFVLSIKNYH